MYKGTQEHDTQRADRKGYLTTLLFNHFFERDKQKKSFANGSSWISGGPTQKHKEDFNGRENQSLLHLNTDITLNGRTDKMQIFSSSEMSSFAFCLPSDFPGIKKLTLLARKQKA